MNSTLVDFHLSVYFHSFQSMITECVEQRYCIKFCQKLGDTQAETIRKIQLVFGEDSMSIIRRLFGADHSPPR